MKITPNIHPLKSHSWQFHMCCVLIQDFHELFIIDLNAEMIQLPQTTELQCMLMMDVSIAMSLAVFQ